MTDVLFVPTKRAIRKKDDVVSYLTSHADYVLNKWNSQIADGDSKYELNTYYNIDIGVHIGNQDDIEDAHFRAKEELEGNGLMKRYDGVCVMDDTSYGLFSMDGWSDVGEFSGSNPSQAAGDDYFNVSYIAGTGGKGLTAHEVTHLYGGKHENESNNAEYPNSTFWNGWWDFSIMGNPNDWSCNGNHAGTRLHRGGWYSQCTKNAVREYIDYWDL